MANIKFRTLVIEDEELPRIRLLRMLGQLEDIEVVGWAENGPQALQLIQERAPDLLFLDIALPGLDGFEVLDRLEKQPAVIFTTASGNEALKAFKTMAIDYLLKPIAAEDLQRAVKKLRSMAFKEPELAATVSRLVRTLHNPYLTRIPCKVGEKTYLVKSADIHYFRSDNRYTMVHTAEKEYLIDTPLVDLEQQLDPKDFVRIHRAVLVNVAWIAGIRRMPSGKLMVILSDKAGTELTTGRSYAENLRNIR